MEVQLHTFFAAAVEGGEWSASRACRNELLLVIEEDAERSVILLLLLLGINPEFQQVASPVSISPALSRLLMAIRKAYSIKNMF
jgi:hypothetical protein